MGEELDRRIAGLEREREAELGRPLTRPERRRFRRSTSRTMGKGMKRALAEMRREISRDTKRAADPGLAERLRKAEPIDAGVFLRFGEPPKRGPSRSVWGAAEGGVSAFAGAMNADGDYVVELGNDGCAWTC